MKCYGCVAVSLHCNWVKLSAVVGSGGKLSALVGSSGKLPALVGSGGKLSALVGSGGKLSLATVTSTGLTGLYDGHYKQGPAPPIYMDL